VINVKAIMDADKLPNTYRFLMSVPHSNCKNVRENICDQTALRGARWLKKKLEAQGHYVVIYNAPNHYHRSQCDLNRKPARNTEWRKLLDQLQMSGQFDALLDMHSYPRNYPDFTGVISAFTGPQSIPWLLSLFPMMHILNSSWKNDIINTSKIPSILIEFPDAMFVKKEQSGGR
jgi:hypothetical protein